jgi:hypothetical protein
VTRAITNRSRDAGRHEAGRQPPRGGRDRQERPDPAQAGRRSAIHQVPSPRTGERAEDVSKTPPERQR